MEFQVIKTPGDAIRPLRELFLREANIQFVCNKCHQYGWADAYLFTTDGTQVGYGAVWGTDRREDRDTIFEFYVLPPFRGLANALFARLCSVSGAVFIESQSNDALLTAMLYEHARNINAEAILFEDGVKTALAVPGAVFRQQDDDPDPAGDDRAYVLERHGNRVASGGLMLNYNLPFADVYLEVEEPFRRQGLGSFLVQELKKEAYRMGRVPAARCNVGNRISKATLLKAGFRVCGFRLKGIIVKS